MIPLACQHFGHPDKRIVNIWFLVDTSSPFTCITEKSFEALVSPDKTPHQALIAIQVGFNIIQQSLVNNLTCLGSAKRNRMSNF